MNQNAKNNIQRFKSNLVDLMTNHIRAKKINRLDVAIILGLSENKAIDLINGECSEIGFEELFEYMLVLGVVNTIKLDESDACKYKVLGDKIGYYRTYCGLSQSQLAKKVGVKQPTISGWEKGMSKPGVKHIDLLTDILNIDSATLLELEPLKSVAVNNSKEIESGLAIDALKALYSERLKVKETSNKLGISSTKLSDEDLGLNDIASILISLGSKPE